MLTCPRCGSTSCVKSGHIHNGKQRYVCKDCRRQFVENPRQKKVSEETQGIVDRLLLERLSLAGISRALEVSADWLAKHIKRLYAGVSRTFAQAPAPQGQLVVECDELWSFVGSKANKRWIWLALDQTVPGQRGRVIGCWIGERGKAGAQGLWDSLPEAYREKADFYTDFWEPYAHVFAAERHYPCGKEDGQTAHIERFNGTLRARCSRLVRKSYAFSKNDDNHQGAIWYFIHHYNNSLRPA